ncbi:uncharacterized [Tachysurus ichikawai]
MSNLSEILGGHLLFRIHTQHMILMAAGDVVFNQELRANKTLTDVFFGRRESGCRSDTDMLLPCCMAARATGELAQAHKNALGYTLPAFGKTTSRTLLAVDCQGIDKESTHFIVTTRGKLSAPLHHAVSRGHFSIGGIVGPVRVELQSDPFNSICRNISKSVYSLGKVLRSCHCWDSKSSPGLELQLHLGPLIENTLISHDSVIHISAR